MTKYIAICMTAQNGVINVDYFPTDKNDPLLLRDEMTVNCQGTTPDSISLLTKDPTNVVASFQRSRDYPSHVDTVEVVADRLKDWIDGLDEEGVLKAFEQLMGVENPKLIGKERISYELP